MAIDLTGLNDVLRARRSELGSGRTPAIAPLEAAIRDLSSRSEAIALMIATVEADDEATMVMNGLERAATSMLDALQCDELPPGIWMRDGSAVDLPPEDGAAGDNPDYAGWTFDPAPV